MTNPLEGKYVVVTRAPHQAGELVDLLLERDAMPLLYPCIDIAPPEDTLALDTALHAIANFDWLVLTSVNTVAAISHRMNALNIPRTDFSHLKVAAVGPATAQAAEDMLTPQVDLIPEDYVGQSLGQSLLPAITSERVLLPQSDIARHTLAQALLDAGADVTPVVSYQTVMGSGGDDVPGLLSQGMVDAVTFTSSSTVDNFVNRLALAGLSPDVVGKTCVACIGSVTEKTAQGYGWANIILPEKHTLPDMLNELETYFARLNAGAQ